MNTKRIIVAAGAVAVLGGNAWSQSLYEQSAPESAPASGAAAGAPAGAAPVAATPVATGPRSIADVSLYAVEAPPPRVFAENDLIQIIVDRNRLEGSIDLVSEDASPAGPEEGARILARRLPRSDLVADAGLPPDTRLWAILQAASGGTWGGCVYDVDAIAAKLGQ